MENKAQEKILELEKEIERLKRVNELLTDKAEQAQAGGERPGLFITNGMLRQKLSEKTKELATAFNELQQRQVQLAQSAQLSSLVEISAGIAHEINNPLTILLTQVYLMDRSLKEENPNLERLSNLAKKSKTTVLRISQIVDAMGAIWSRGEEGTASSQTEPGEVIRLARDLTTRNFETAGIGLSWPDASEDAFKARLFCNPSQAAQSLVHLLWNSLEALRRAPKRGWVKVECALEEGFCALSVTDSGEGIKEELIEKIFQPFFTTKEIGEGAGLGLSMALGNIKGQGGELYYDKESPNTRFVLKLPLSSEN